MSEMLDLCGLKCPLPILKIRRAMQSLRRGDVLDILATDPGIVRDLPDYCAYSGHKILRQHEENGVYAFTLEKT